ncbi:hypothetical protein [Hyalangium rubrum]|uniref:Uncharacterized protein n=1 Tax=Hyalangium rubrum TaxID=3103134 RepID=A0ABU5H767_9BACT|nr:hypothetical protein [Hyalangium sp. s54d21]MDY7229136.1 hypothetical protein [Hyalangium sp. s54d21]
MVAASCSAPVACVERLVVFEVPLAEVDKLTEAVMDGVPPLRDVQ